MLPNTQPEGNPQAPAGGTEPPASSPSGAQGQPLPDYVVALQGQVESLTKMVQGVQKGTDKQIGQVRGDIKRILELGGKGLDETQIQRELYIDSLVSSQNTPVQQPVGNVQPNTGLDTEAVINSLKFEPNDPALAALKIKHANNPNALIQAAAELRIAQATAPTPSPATQLPQNGGSPTASLSEEQIDQKALRLEELYKNYSVNKREIGMIEAELENAGVIKRR